MAAYMAEGLETALECELLDISTQKQLLNNSNSNWIIAST